MVASIDTFSKSREWSVWGTSAAQLPKFDLDSIYVKGVDDANPVHAVEKPVQMESRFEIRRGRFPEQ